MPFRLAALLADRVALSLINRGQLSDSDFRLMENGAVLLRDEARRTALTVYQGPKKDELEHPFLKERVPLGLLPHVQASLLARMLRGDIDAYPPMIWK